MSAAHTWQTANTTGTMTCTACHLMPLDDDDMAMPCPIAARASALETIEDMTANAIANAVDESCDNKEAADYYTGIRDAVAEAVTRLDWRDDLTADEAVNVHEIADGAVSVWNHDLLMQLIGTRAYYRTPGGTDGTVLDIAGAVLYDLAREVATHLLGLVLDAYREEMEL